MHLRALQAACCIHPAALQAIPLSKTRSRQRWLCGWRSPFSGSSIQLHFTAEQQALLPTFIQLQSTVLIESCSEQRCCDVHILAPGTLAMCWQ